MYCSSRNDAFAYLRDVGVNEEELRGRKPNFLIPDYKRQETFRVARAIAKIGFLRSNWSMLLIDEFGVWPSSEDRHLLAALRGYHHEYRPLHEKPAHYFDAYELPILASFLHVALENVYGGFVIFSADSFFRFTHDEVVHVFSDEPTEAKEWLEKFMIDFRLQL